jgi:signal transduction histidine kinase
LVESFFVTNHAIVASMSGQAFFVVGLLSVWELRRYSSLPLARPLWMLAAFGLLYALAEWGQVFIPIQERYLPPTVTDMLWLLRVLLMAAAFGALCQFGIELLPPHSRGRLRIVAPILFLVWIGLTIGSWRFVGGLDEAVTMGEIEARLLLALPAGLVGGLGLWLQDRSLRSVGGDMISRWLRVASASSALVGLTLGLMLPGVGVWPGTEWLLGIPSEVWRGIAGALFALGLARTLAVFQFEQDQLVEEAERRTIAAQARERLTHQLSDGIIQRLYAVGLLLSGAAGELPADDPIHVGLRELDESITALRELIVDRGHDTAKAEAGPRSPSGQRCTVAMRPGACSGERHL